MGCGERLGWMQEARKEHDWKTSIKEIWGRKKIGLYEWIKNMKISVSHVNVHQRVTSAENFNYQVDRMTHSVDTCQPLSSANLVIAQWTPEQSGYDGRDGGLTWTQWHGLSLTKSTWLCYC